MKLGITGYPLTYTQSPQLHREFLRKARLKGEYEVLPFDPARGKRAFFSFLDELADAGFVGLNVTVPLKEWAFEYCKKRGGMLSGIHGRAAVKVAAVNTVLFKKRGAKGANTDAVGLWDDLAKWPAFSKLKRGAELVIVGTGGSARGAIAGLLARHPASKKLSSIKVIGRDPKKVRVLERLLKRPLKKSSSVAIDSLVLWCLPPLGLEQARELWREAVLIDGEPSLKPRNILLYDLNYGERAHVTAQLTFPKNRREGDGMLRRQALASFKIWTAKN